MNSYWMRYVLISIVAVCLVSCSKHEGEIISIRSDMLINETAYGNVMSWFDEQDTSLVPVSQWETPGQKDFWPAGLVIDLGKEYQITGIWVYDGPKTNFNGSDFEHSGGTLQINTGEPFKWENNFIFQLSNDSSWHFLEFSKTTRYIQLQKVPGETYMWGSEGPFQSDPEIREVIFLGYPVEAEKAEHKSQYTNTSQKVKTESDEKKSKYSGMQFPMDQFIGVNSFSWNSDELHSQIGFIREYHHWKLNGVKSVMDPISWISNDGKVNFDSFYERNQGKACVDIHRHVIENQFGEARPDFGGNPEDPASYDLLSDYIFQFAARYGKSSIPDNLLRVKPGEPNLSGLNHVSYIENWNEPDRWWGKDGEHFTPYQMCAMSSATFDGNQGKMGANRGGKTADSTMNMVLGGLSSLDTSYIIAMKWWSDYYRNGSFPANVISFHHYCNTSGGQGFKSITKGISPEADDFKGRMQKLVDWRNRNLPDCEIWISEFGWDTDPLSPQAAIAHTQYPENISSDELQAIWLIRGYLAGSAAGIDRMFMFMLNDEEGAGLFKSCGLVTAKNERKMSWYYLSTFTKNLKDTYFSGVIYTSHPDVWIYKFSDKKSAKEVYVLWCPTSDGTSVKNFMFSIPATVSNASLIKFQDKNPNGIESQVSLTHNIAEVEVTETPVMLVINR